MDQHENAPLDELLLQAHALGAALESAQQAGQDVTELEGELYQLQLEIEQTERRAMESRRARVAQLGSGLLQELGKRKGERQLIELRWLRDLRRYNAEYEPEKARALEEREFGSRAFVPLTRRIVNVVEARLGDLLFPVDDLNFGVQSSPVPELDEAAKAVTMLPDEAPLEVDGEPAQASDLKASIGELIDDAKAKAAGMQREIADQRMQSDYATEARRVIRDGLVLGLGVMKGPTLYLKTKKKWVIQPDGRATMEVVEDTTPQSARVDPWLFYPEIAAKSMKDCSSVFEGHPMTRTQFAALARQPGFDADAIREELMAPAVDTTDANLKATQEASGTAGVQQNRYMVWEYHGPIDAHDLQACGCEIPDDPLIVYSGVVFFTQTGRVIKAVVNVLQSGELPYHCWSWQPDANSLFGFGLPYEIADMQDAANSSWRAAQDNMGLSVGGMLVVDTEAIAPENGRYEIAPRKVFRKRVAGGRVEDYLQFIEIPSRVQDLLAVFTMAKQLADEVGGPMLAMQGQDAPSYVETATGMSIAYNAASVWMRRAVKGWDDFITIPETQQYIDWNMQHNPKREIKGDLRPVARGSSHLLEAEGQVQRILALMKSAEGMGIPIRKAVGQLRAMCRAMRLDEQELLPDDKEIAAMEEQQRNSQPQLTPEQERIQIRQMELKDRQEDRAHSAALAEQTNQIRLAELAQKEGLTVEQTRAKYELDVLKVEAQMQDRREQRAHDAAALNAEIATRVQTGAGV